MILFFDYLSKITQNEQISPFCFDLLTFLTIARFLQGIQRVGSAVASVYIGAKRLRKTKFSALYIKNSI